MFTQFLQLTGLAKKWPIITHEEVAKHNTTDSLWILVGTSVLDVTSLIGHHPGGNSALLKRGGGVKDCTEDMLFHGRATRQDAQRYKIGELSPCDAQKLASRRATAPSRTASQSEAAPPARTQVFVPTDLHEAHTSGSDSEQWDEGVKDHPLSSSDTDYVLGLDAKRLQSTTSSLW
ncbi:Cytochrome b5-like Heme/Steroid binding domain containing protein [Novymonas esmeraldas]|uniref:Cytochrome b5-like Heme/Steroid binding domain containing protein n=1 Tax=Novymonas esmeraldas TaxID=1808958 RepID=A0AAW0EN53_9TRYP